MRTFRVKQQARPIRYAYLVNSLADVLKAVDFLSNCWGGSLSSIVPIPKETTNRKSFTDFLERNRPDLVAHNESILPSWLVNDLSTYPIQYFPLTGKDVVDRFASENIPILYRERLFPHINTVHPLEYDNQLPKIDHIILLACNYIRSTTTNQQKSHTQRRYRRYLDHAILSAASTSIRNKTCRGLSISVGSSLPLDGNDFLFLYLYEGEEDLLCFSSFWNDSFMDSENKLLLSREDFRTDINYTIDQVLKYYRKIKYLRVITSLAGAEAIHLYQELQQVVSRVRSDVAVDILLDANAYNQSIGTAVFGHPKYTVHSTAEEHIELTPPIPSNYVNTAYAFAVDVELNVDDNDVGVPYTRTSSNILTFGHAVIEKYKYDMEILEKLYSSTFRLIPSEHGFSFIASHLLDSKAPSYTPCSVPPPKQFFGTYLRLNGMSIKPNPAAQYTGAVLRRLQSEGNHLQNLDILKCLVSPRGEERDRSWRQIIADYKKLFRTDATSSDIQHCLLALIKTKLVTRRQFIECPSCLMEYGTHFMKAMSLLSA